MVLSAALLAAGASPAVVDRAAASPRAGLPRHFGIGVSAEPDATGLYGWMPKTRVPFDYAYTYLAAGVNTGNGWQTWNTNAEYPLLYARGARKRGYVPVFPYYMLLQSTGSCDACPEAQRDLTNLNTPSLTAAYYRDFAMLMKRLGPKTYGGVAGFGGTAIVHVEPDLSGYAEQAVLGVGGCFGFCAGTGNNPSYLKASVKSSGVNAVAGYPNTYRGFNLALLHLRDLYAPNVLLAFHVSGWTTGYDIDSQTQAANAAALGKEAGTFAARSGVGDSPAGTSTYDLVFNDVADRDAGYYQHVLHQDVWWDRRNQTLPNFHRWERYIGAITTRTQRPAMIWQIPLSNQHFRTENNTDGHYQDNRAEYFFHHIPELKNVGVIALLFGAGNAGSTVNFNGKGDGVTNPASFCTHDGTSGAAICNTAKSAYADDDGGYLRIQARAYYRNPVPLR